MAAALTRSTLFDAMLGEAWLAGLTLYAEPPDQLAGAALVISPRDPYRDYSTFGRLSTFLTISVLLPRTHGPAMDRIDAILSDLYAFLEGLDACELGPTRLGITDTVGGIEYIAAMVDITLS